MSNSWVVHGSRTASGRPILANDPHLAIEMPSVWWEVHVVSENVNVAGVTIPGIPFVIIGHNERIGWGLTNVGADVQDFFVEQLDPARERIVRNNRGCRSRASTTAFGFEDEANRSSSPCGRPARGPLLRPEDWHDPQPGAASLSPHMEERVLSLKWDVAPG